MRSCVRPAVYLLFLLCCTHANGQQLKLVDTDIFDSTRLLEVEIELPEASWDRLRWQSRDFRATLAGIAPRPYRYYRGSAKVNGVLISSVGIRKKGLFGSQDSERPSLKIKFDEFVDQEPVKGFDRLTLNNNKQDRSLLSQFLTYEMFRRAGVAAPRVSLARVTVNGRYLGIYSNVESVRKPFLKRAFGNDKGFLYEGTLTDFDRRAIGNFDQKTKKKSKERADLTALAKALERPSIDLKEVEQLVDVDHFLRFWAVESLLGFWDGYSSNQNNYFVYQIPTKRGPGKFRFIPWGADSAYTTRSPFGRWRQRRTNVVYSQSILANRLARHPQIANRYREAMKRILSTAWNESHLLAESYRLERLVRTKLHANQSSMTQGLDAIREFIRTRRSTIERELQSTQWPPPIDSAPRTPTYITSVGAANGVFNTAWNAEDESDLTRLAQLQLRLDGETISYDQLSVYIYPTAPQRGFGRRRFLATAPEELWPIRIEVDIQKDNESIYTLQLVAPRHDFQKGKLTVYGVLREPGEVDSGFPFGGGPRRLLAGELELKQAGRERGARVVGRFNLKVVESHAGLFGRR